VRTAVGREWGRARGYTVKTLWGVQPAVWVEWNGARGHTIAWLRGGCFISRRHEGCKSNFPGTSGEAQALYIVLHGSHHGLDHGHCA
jgi:hypothetical protein